MKYLLPLLLGIITAVALGYGFINRADAPESLAAALFYPNGSNLPVWAIAGISDGCAEWSSNVLTSSGSGCAGGGGGSWATSTNLVYTTDFVVVGASATSTNALFEVNGLAQFDYASTTALTATTLYGALVGNADTATALAANGANCSAGNAPLGVDASGAVESCFDVWTEAENTAAAYLSTVDISDNTNLAVTAPITLTGDTVGLNQTGITQLGTITTGVWNGTQIDISDYTNLVAGTNITLSGDTLNVDDVFLLNDGDVGIGTFDFGGASSFEIVNASNPTVNATGEIALNTTSSTINYYDGTVEQVLSPFWSKTINLENATTTDGTIRFGFITDVAVTVTAVKSVANCANPCSVSADFNIVHSTNQQSTGNDLFTSDQTVTSTTTLQTFSSGFNDATIPQDSIVWLDIPSANETQITNLKVTLFGRIDP